jgi:hypothetical protein
MAFDLMCVNKASQGEKTITFVMGASSINRYALARINVWIDETDQSLAIHVCLVGWKAHCQCKLSTKQVTKMTRLREVNSLAGIAMFLVLEKDDAYTKKLKATPTTFNS